MSIKFKIFGEPVSLKNSRQLVSFGSGDKKRPALIKSKKALQYERDAVLQIPPQARQMIDCPVKVTLRIFYASERPDLDESIVLDVLQARYKKSPVNNKRVLITKGVYLNDRLVREKHVHHGIDRLNPRTEIEIEPLQASMAYEA